jgi:hypothetical protein
MFSRITTVVGTGLLLALVTGPAVAGIVTVRLPEPATISLFGVAAAGAFVARRFWGRK